MLTPVAYVLPRSIHPTALTLAAFGAGIGAGLAIWRQAYGLALALWLLNRALDGLDGTFARVHGRQTDFGGYLDVLLDTVVYAAIPATLALHRPSSDVWLSLVALLGSFYINGASWMYLAALLEQRRQGASAQGELTTITMPTGIIEGTETLAFYTLFLLFPGAIVPLFWTMALLVFATIGQRLLWARRIL
ncbi:MAG TPA: CDP-alcohol phosphatidyltransferase family protein [Herpetosiphonaceae bacterium]